MMESGDDRKCIQEADQESSDTERKSDQRSRACQDPSLNSREDRSDHCDGKKPGDQYGNQRCNKEINHLRNNLMQLLLNPAHKQDRNNNRDNMSLIAYICDAVAADMEKFLDRRIEDHRAGTVIDVLRPRIYQRRMDHDKSDNSSQELVAPKLFRRTDRDQNRQHRQCRAGKQIDNLIQRAVCHTRPDLCHTAEKTVQKTGRDDRRNDRNENITQRFDRAEERILLRCCRLLDIILRALRNTRHLDKFVVNLIDCSGTDDDLDLSGRLKAPLNAVNILYRRLVHLRLPQVDQ